MFRFVCICACVCVVGGNSHSVCERTSCKCRLLFNFLTYDELHELYTHLFCFWFLLNSKQKFLFFGTHTSRNLRSARDRALVRVFCENVRLFVYLNLVLCLFSTCNGVCLISPYHSCACVYIYIVGLQLRPPKIVHSIHYQGCYLLHFFQTRFHFTSALPPFFFFLLFSFSSSSSLTKTFYTNHVVYNKNDL